MKVNKGLKLKIYPDEKTIPILNMNMGHTRFVWNKLLEEVKYLHQLFQAHGYTFKVNTKNLNAILNQLKV